MNGKYLNNKWGVGAKHALYRLDGKWYHILKRFPGALFDENGYVLFNTEKEYRSNKYLKIVNRTNHTHVPRGLSSMPNYVKKSSSMINTEINRRENLWSEMLQMNSAKSITPTILRELRIYGGAAGIWKDTQTTREYTEDGNGITVSVLHTGTSYPDDLFADGIIYHYPDTKRHPSFDENEIESTKNCKRFNVPLFIITHSEENSSLRDVNLGWVEMWDDDAKEFLITFSELPPEELLEYDEEAPFTAFENAINRRRTSVNARPNQGRFRIGVLKRYGCHCAVCDIENAKLLDAAHLIDRGLDGTDDLRNGIVLCKNHHAAFDKKLFKINPETYELVFNDVDANSLKTTKNDINHLEQKPHALALQWRWDD